MSESQITLHLPDQELTLAAWGPNTIRVTASPYPLKTSWPLAKVPGAAPVQLTQADSETSLTSGSLTARFAHGRLLFEAGGKVLLKEFQRQNHDPSKVGAGTVKTFTSFPASQMPRVFTPQNDLFSATLLLEGNAEEKLYGMGQYQESSLNKNGGTYELMQRNSQTSLPFYLSDRGYGFLWYQPAVGQATFAKNQRRFTASVTDRIDYLVTAGQTPKQILTQYTGMVGRPPQMDPDLLGLWQSKLRYQTPKEVEAAFDGYQQRGITPSVLVIDFFHWPHQGDFRFDNTYWQDLEGVANKLHQAGTKLCASIWPTVEPGSENFEQLKQARLLVEQYHETALPFNGTAILDLTNPKARQFLQEKLAANYSKRGIDLFWADVAEPELTPYTHAPYHVAAGNFAQVASTFPLAYVKAVQGGKVKEPVLIRSAWFGSQKLGALLWSGDVESSFASFKRQIQGGLSAGLAGQSWWTSDIGGFQGGDVASEEFKELLVRWFEFATFSPILRMHGDRQPHTDPIGTAGGGRASSGGPNEIWAFGPTVEKILTHYIRLRQQLRPYLKAQYQTAADTGIPLMRPLFVDYPDDARAYQESSSYLFGPDLLIAPVTDFKARTAAVYLPIGDSWRLDEKVYTGGQTVTADAPLAHMPVFVKVGSEIDAQHIAI